MKRDHIVSFCIYETLSNTKHCLHYFFQLMCDDSDLKDIGVPMGPRKKLMGYIKDYKEKERRKEEELQEKLAAQVKEAEISIEQPTAPDNTVIASAIPPQINVCLYYIV